MYGGLFGDLPSAKNSKNDGTSTQNDAATEQARKEEEEAKNKVENKNKSVVSGLGSAGTSMAFVPTTLRQRKRPAPTNLAHRVVKPVVPAAAKVAAPVEIIHAEPTPAPNKEESKVNESKQEESLSPVLMEEDSDEFRQLHASVKDPYDPLVPNDLLAYWERKAHEKQRLELERSAKETLERQRRLREQLEQERQAVEKTGDVQQIAQHRAEKSMGRGRGRGMSNLPAWLVQQQQDKLGDNKGQQHTVQQTGFTVLLANLTAPGDIDDDLAAEVQEECEETCGKVESVRVEDAVPPQQPEVRVYVTFADKAHAEKAERLFQGRQFGQRSITAKLV